MCDFFLKSDFKETVYFQTKDANLGLKWVITKTAVTRLHPKRFLIVALEMTCKSQFFLKKVQIDCPKAQFRFETVHFCYKKCKPWPEVGDHKNRSNETSPKKDHECGAQSSLQEPFFSQKGSNWLSKTSIFGLKQSIFKQNRSTGNGTSPKKVLECGPRNDMQKS